MTRRSWTAIAAVAMAVAVSGCSGAAAKTATWPAATPIAPLQIEANTVLYGERLSGRILRLDLRAPKNAPVEIAKLTVDGSGEQRGLVGLASIHGNLYAAWVRPGDLRLVVGHVDGDRTLIWIGPVTGVKAIGGHLGVLGDRLVTALGELVKDPALAGRVFTLDPSGAENQTPVIVSKGWHNPFAFVVHANNVVVADNAPDGVPERLGQVPLPEKVERAPSAIVVTPNGRYGICGYLDGEMRGYTINDDGGVERSGTIISSDCRTGATALADGRYVITDDDTVRLVSPRG